MKDISVLIVEDQVGVALDIENKVIQLGYKVEGTCKDEAELLEKLKTVTPSILLLDIDLGIHSKSGIEIADELLRKYNLPFIFVSGIDNRDSERVAVSKHPSGYIHKPVHLKQLRTEILRVLNVWELAQEQRKKSNKIWIKDGHDDVRVDLSEILYLEADAGYCKMYLRDHPQPMMRTETMSSVLRALNDSRFVQIHRKYAINWDHVSAIKGGQIQLNHVSELVSIGRAYRDEVERKKDTR